MNIFLDKEGDDLVVHVFLIGKEPPIHCAKKIPGIAKDYGQVADMINSRSRKVGEELDHEFINALTYGMGIRVLTFLKDGLKIKMGSEEITDLDGFIPDRNVWIEITSSKRPKEHFLKKVGSLSLCREVEVTFVTSEFDPREGEYITKEEKRRLEGLKLFYVGLYPMEYEINRDSSWFRSCSLLDSKDAGKIRKLIVREDFEELCWARVSEIRSRLEEFLKA